jgi:hypothetical protein
MSKRQLVLGVAGAALSLLVLVIVPGASAEGQEQAAHGRLSADTIVDGVPCAAGHYWRFADGHLHRCQLSRAAKVHGVELPAKSTVAFEPGGTWAFVFLPGTTVLEGHRCRGGGHSYMTEFHENGRLKLCWLEHEEVIDGVPCARATFLGEVFGGGPSGVIFHEDGKLAGCRASRDVTINGRTFRKGERVGQKW